MAMDPRMMMGMGGQMEGDVPFLPDEQEGSPFADLERDELEELLVQAIERIQELEHELGYGDDMEAGMGAPPMEPPAF